MQFTSGDGSHSTKGLTGTPQPHQAETAGGAFAVALGNVLGTKVPELEMDARAPVRYA